MKNHVRIENILKKNLIELRSLKLQLIYILVVPNNILWCFALNLSWICSYWAILSFVILHRWTYLRWMYLNYIKIHIIFPQTRTRKMHWSDEHHVYVTWLCFTIWSRENSIISRFYAIIKRANKLFEHVEFIVQLIFIFCCLICKLFIIWSTKQYFFVNVISLWINSTKILIKSCMPNK